MKHPFIIIALFSITLLYSCTKEIDITLDEDDSFLVIDGILTVDKPIGIRLTNAVSMMELKANFEKISGATVKLFVDNVFVQELQEDSPGFYSAEIFPEYGKNYRVEASYENYPTAIGEHRMFEPVQPDRISASIDSSYGYRYNLIIDITDTGDEISAYNLLSESNQHYIWIDEDGSEHYGEEFGQNGMLSEPTPKPAMYASMFDDVNSPLIADTHFNGKQTQFLFTGLYFSYEEKRIKLSIYSISDAMYRYTSSLNKYIEAEDDVFSEPVTIYSNIENGYGIFSGYSYYVTVFDIEDYLIK